MAEANPEQSDDPEPNKKRYKPSNRPASEGPSAQASGEVRLSSVKAEGPGPSLPPTAASVPSSQSPPAKAESEGQQWSEQLQQQRVSWSKRCDHILAHGGVKPSELDAVTAECEQYLWGDTDTEAVKAVADKLLDAKAWVAKVYSFTKNKPTLQALQPIIQRVPPPCIMPAFTKLKEAYHQAEAWLVRAAEPLAGQPTELRLIEMLCSEASRIPINIPEAKGLRETMNAARKLAENLRNLLPTNREAGRVRRKGEVPVDVESLRAIKVGGYVFCVYSWQDLRGNCHRSCMASLHCRSWHQFEHNATPKHCCCAGVCSGLVCDKVSETCGLCVCSQSAGRRDPAGQKRWKQHL